MINETGPTAVEAVMRDVVVDRDARLDERELDEILADSFPASDPPPWTLGVRVGTRSIAAGFVGEGGPPGPVLQRSESR